MHVPNAEPGTSPGADRAASPLATRLARELAAAPRDLGEEVAAKVRTCLYDLIGCALEAGGHPWSRQAQAIAARAGAAGVTIIGSRQTAAVADAAFVNAVMGHGLVREDMHAASISHLGVAVIPAVLALAQLRRASGRELLAAIVAGYEVGARIGRALMDPDLARMRRPTGLTGPIGAAAAGALLLGLDQAQTTSALALAANTTAGLNEWGHTGGSEMYFHPGFAARNAVTAVLLAEAGAFASPSALDGEAGLFTSLGKRASADAVRLFTGSPEILAVYHKPVPACNFAQTPTQVALTLARAGKCPPGRIEAITIRVPRAGAAYPGCDFRGPFAHVLQAKMSIQYNVAATLLTGDASEANFGLLEDAALQRLLARTRLEVDAAMTRAYPAQQGGAVEVLLVDGTRHDERLPDVVNATSAEVRERFRAAAAVRLGAGAAARIEQLIEQLQDSDDAGRLPAALGAPALPAGASA